MFVFKNIVFLILTLFILNSVVYAQDSADVTFRFKNGSQPYLVGEFNGWNNSVAPMNYEGIWVRTERLQIQLQ